MLEKFVETKEHVFAEGSVIQLCLNLT